MPVGGLYEVRPLRRKEFPSYREVVLLAVGPLERTTGLEASAEATVDLLSRRSVWFLLGLLRLVGRPIVDVLVAADERTVVGTATLLWLPGTGYVAGVATRPEWRGRGIASRILAELSERARRRRRSWLALDVESENATARQVYRNAGYRESGEFTWFTRPTLPPAEPATPRAADPVMPSQWAGLSARLDASRPAEYRAAFPAGERIVSHNEYLVRGGRAEHRTWKCELAGGGVAAVRAYFLPGARMAVYFPVTSHPEPAAEEVLAPLDAATGWLRARGPYRILAVAAEPRGGVAEALERRGFSAVVSSTVMLRRSAERAPGP